MWSPTHIQVTVQRARGLLIKGKNGHNNCFVTIGVGKEKYQTSIKEKAVDNLEWFEECELTIPNQGNKAELVLTILHRNNFGVDEFLGQSTLPLNEMDVYERPRSRWLKLQSKPGQEKKNKERGELEVKIAFTVKAGSLTDLSKKEKHKSSLSQLGGSLLSLGNGEKRKGLKNFAKSLGSKVHLSGKSKKDKKDDSGSVSGSVSSLGTPGSGAFAPRRFGQSSAEADPGVISEDDDEFILESLSQKSSHSSINVKSNADLRHSPLITKAISNSMLNVDEDLRSRSRTLPPSKPPRFTPDQPDKVDEWEAKLYGSKHNDIGSSDSLKRRSTEFSRVPLNALSEEKSSVVIENTSSTAPSTPILDFKKNNNGDNKLNNSQSSSSLNNTGVSEQTDKYKEKYNKKDKTEKRFSKLKYFRKDKSDSLEELKERKTLPSLHQIDERIIIGHENNFGFPKHSVDVQSELIKKYGEKTKEELMVIANDYENEIKVQKHKIKELEDYLDNLLLRVMETHPKILQNPYKRMQSTKSG